MTRLTRFLGSVAVRVAGLALALELLVRWDSALALLVLALGSLGVVAVGACADAVRGRWGNRSPFGPLLDVALWPTVSALFALFVSVRTTGSWELVAFVAVPLVAAAIAAACLGLAIRTMRAARREHLRDHPAAAARREWAPHGR